MGTSGEAMILMEELSAVSDQAIIHQKKQNAGTNIEETTDWGNKGKHEILSSQFVISKCKGEHPGGCAPLRSASTVEEIFLMADG
jgi:hypothetical protein